MKNSVLLCGKLIKINKALKPILTFVVFVFLFTNCQQQEISKPNVANSLNKIATNQTIQFKYTSHWDNRFNETIFQDSAKIIYSHVNGNTHNFGFFTDYGNMATIFDGFKLENIQHEDKMIILSDSIEIQNTSDYFDYYPIFVSSPLELLRSNTFDTLIDTIINNKKYIIGKNTSQTTSKTDSTQIVIYENFYYFNQTTELLEQRKAVTVRSSDTLQIMNHYFSDYQFDTIPFDFNTIDRTDWQAYNVISEDDYDNERHLKQKSVGDKLIKKTYQDINNRPIHLYGTGKQTVIMFSFIGCHGCEAALKKFKAREYKFKSNINFYYSSPQDKQKPILNYSKKKDFSFPTFSKESEMNKELKTYFYPTFVVISNDGTVQDIISGYNKDVLKLLFDE